jgi:hypothetical protein
MQESIKDEATLRMGQKDQQKKATSKVCRNVHRRNDGIATETIAEDVSMVIRNFSFFVLLVPSFSLMYSFYATQCQVWHVH